MGMIEADLENYKELVRDGKFVCAKCGRVAREAKSLCSPVAL
jgi:transcription initiation factor TFIIIB Brf1 subunit/transcription initiation factor TFIIB